MNPDDIHDMTIEQHLDWIETLADPETREKLKTEPNEQ